MRYIMKFLSYIHNRFIHPSHKVTIRNKEYGKGRYHDPDNQLLYVMFQCLIDFIEIDCASRNSKYYQTKLQKIINFFIKNDTLDYLIPPTRNAKQGLHYLRWEKNLKDTNPSQSESAKAFLKLYKFWVHDRPSRVDPWDLVSDDESVDIMEKIKSHTPLEFSDKYLQAIRQAGALEEQYHQEDQEMLHLLITHRRSMWT